MTVISPSLTSGKPVFKNAQQAALAQSMGLEAAWRLALADGRAAAVAEVTGSFAVGIADVSGAVFMAVDRFAIESLCYRIDGDRLSFAARADQLGRADEIDPQAIYDYLYFHVIPSPRTIYKNVHRLPPGHFASFEQGRLTVVPYWKPTFEPRADANFGALREEFLGLLGDAVSSQLDGSKPACFLSGGTDSSTIAGMLGQVSGAPAATYSIGFEAQGYDEMEFARIAAKHFKTDHHEYYVTPADLVRSVADVAAHYDQPFGNSSALPSFYCAKMARDDGVSHILGGDGGDELFGGNTRYAKEKVFGLYESIPASLRHGVLEPLLDRQWALRTPLLRKAASYVRQARVPMPDRTQTYNLVERLGIDQVLTARFLESVDVEAPKRDQRAVWTEANATGLLDRMLAFDWRYTLAECDLPKVSGTTQLAGVSVGFPMLDQRLVDFSMRLPTAYKLKGFKLRWFFKEALRGFLPDDIITKKKQGFGLPFGVWANQDTALKRLSSDSLNSLADRGIVNAAFVRSLLDTRLAEHPGYYGEMVWILMMLEQWLRRHAPSLRV